MTGTIYSGINNIFTVRQDAENPDWYECRIKGKILKGSDQYSPLAPGDRVEFEPTEASMGSIIRRLERQSRFSRWNRKKNAWQVIAANIDSVFVISSANKPPFRPRFVDRVLLAASIDQVDVTVVLNKVDQGIDDWVTERVVSWEGMGIPVLQTSGLCNTGLDDLRSAIGSGCVAFFGASGAGKTTLINSLVPGLSRNTGAISEKHQRGKHVTNFGQLIDTDWGAQIIDTPGVRELAVSGISPRDLHDYFTDFTREPACNYANCTHREEPGCSILQAVNEGRIHPDRYQSYLGIRAELEDQQAFTR